MKEMAPGLWELDEEIIVLKDVKLALKPITAASPGSMRSTKVLQLVEELKLAGYDVEHGIYTPAALRQLLEVPKVEVYREWKPTERDRRG